MSKVHCSTFFWIDYLWKEMDNIPVKSLSPLRYTGGNLFALAYADLIYNSMLITPSFLRKKQGVHLYNTLIN